MRLGKILFDHCCVTNTFDHTLKLMILSEWDLNMAVKVGDA
ncbi:103_t:CDS:2 [Ambispora leptoticha]|uniref:103_t:CDS:1 n=1 Tax=Ambispora leptoticha TaxID=144679 RepID=A0A9N8VQV3_9GLOM|nr:103_t:CDS:2 [Ambispora leptoticha]